MTKGRLSVNMMVLGVSSGLFALLAVLVMPDAYHEGMGAIYHRKLLNCFVTPRAFEAMVALLAACLVVVACRGRELLEELEPRRALGLFVALPVLASLVGVYMFEHRTFSHATLHWRWRHHLAYAMGNVLRVIPAVAVLLVVFLPSQRLARRLGPWRLAALVLLLGGVCYMTAFMAYVQFQAAEIE